MKIEVGKFYRTRDGRKVGPMALPKPDDVFRWNALGDRWGRWRDDGEDGNATGGTFEAGGDLIAEWIDPMDLTAITTPFGLLDRETQEALKAHGGQLQYFCAGAYWLDQSGLPQWFPELAYRVKPEPREWHAVGRHLYDTEADAVAFRQTCADMHGPHHLETPIIHVREVLPE